MKEIFLESTKVGFGKGVVEAAKEDPSIVVIGSDITSSVGLDLFKEIFPERFISLGIAEQNAIAVASGMALSGLKPIVSTYAAFSVMRTLDQIRISACYNELPIIIGGAHSGISVGPDGATHQALEDISALRALPHLTILSPCDSIQTEEITKLALKTIKGPIYIRYGREPRPVFTLQKQSITIGKAQILKTGNDITLIATGHLVWECLKACDELIEYGISTELINIHTIKPLDTEAIIKSAIKTNRIITAEEHSIIGGLGSAIAEVLSKNAPTKMDFVGINNKFGESGEPDELMEKYELTSKTIIRKALKLLGR